MKLTKKAAALLLAAALAVSVCATPVFAADPEMGSQTVTGKNPIGAGVGHTSVLYKVTESYTWTVPITIDFGENAGVGNTSTVDANLDGDKEGKKAEKDSAGTTWKGTAPKVCVTENVIGVGKNLKIAVDTGDHSATSFETDKFYVETADTKEKLYFTITKPVTGGTAVKLTKTENEVLRVPSGTNTANQELVFELKTAEGDNVAEKAGTYEGVVAFYSSIVG